MRKSYAVIIDANLDQIVASVAAVAVAVAVAGRTAVAVAIVPIVI